MARSAVPCIQTTVSQSIFYHLMQNRMQICMSLFMSNELTWYYIKVEYWSERTDVWSDLLLFLWICLATAVTWLSPLMYGCHKLRKRYLFRIKYSWLRSLPHCEMWLHCRSLLQDYLLFLSGITIINSNLRFSKSIQGLIKSKCNKIYLLFREQNVSLPILGHFLSDFCFQVEMSRLV